MRQLLITLILALPLMTVSAQPDHKSGDSQSRKAMGVWKMTEELELTENQAEKFFPKFRTHQDAVDKLREEQRVSLKSIHESLKDGKDISDEDLAAAIKSFQKIEGSKISSRVDFIESLEGVLTTSQRAKLMLAPDKMRREAKENIKEHKKSRQRRQKRDRW
jgi:Spy/CpxP family protein refolding chaperone